MKNLKSVKYIIKNNQLNVNKNIVNRTKDYSIDFKGNSTKQ